MMLAIRTMTLIVPSIFQMLKEFETQNDFSGYFARKVLYPMVMYFGEWLQSKIPGLIWMN